MGEASPLFGDNYPTLSYVEALSLARSDLDNSDPITYKERITDFAFSAATLGVWSEFKQEFGKEIVEGQVNDMDVRRKSSLVAKLALGGQTADAEALLHDIDDKDEHTRALVGLAENAIFANNFEDVKKHLVNIYGEDRNRIVGHLFTLYELNDLYGEADALRKTEQVGLDRILISAEGAAEELKPDRFDEIIKFALKNLPANEPSDDSSQDYLHDFKDAVVAYVKYATLSDPDNVKDDTSNYFNSALYVQHGINWGDRLDPKTLRDWTNEGYMSAMLELGNISYAFEIACLGSGSEADLQLLEIVKNDNWAFVCENIAGASSGVLRVLLMLAQQSVDDKEIMLTITEEMLSSVSDNQQLDLETIGEVAFIEAYEEGEWETAIKLFKSSKAIASSTGYGYKMVNVVLDDCAAENHLNAEGQNQEAVDDITETLHEIIGSNEELFKHAHYTLDGEGRFEEADSLREYFCEKNPEVYESDVLEPRINIVTDTHDNWGLAIQTAEKLNQLNEGIDGYKILAIEALKAKSYQRI